MYGYFGKNLLVGISNLSSCVPQVGFVRVRRSEPQNRAMPYRMNAFRHD
jgi:hypothetical protein